MGRQVSVGEIQYDYDGSGKAGERLLGKESTWSGACEGDDLQTTYPLDLS